MCLSALASSCYLQSSEQSGTFWIGPLRVYPPVLTHGKKLSIYHAAFPLETAVAAGPAEDAFTGPAIYRGHQFAIHSLSRDKFDISQWSIAVHNPANGEMKQRRVITPTAIKNRLLGSTSRSYGLPLCWTIRARSRSCSPSCPSLTGLA